MVQSQVMRPAPRGQPRLEGVVQRPAAETDGAQAATWAQVERGRRPLALLIKAGSLAGAVLSIFGLVVLVFPALDRDASGSGRVSTVLAHGQEIKLAVDRDVERMTYGHWLELETGSRDGVTPDEQRVPGVDIRYAAEFPGYANRAPFKARFTLKDQAGVTRHQHTTTGRLDADRDLCRCAEFVPVPTAAASYRVLVELYRPGAPWAAPVLSSYTDWFSAAEAVSRHESTEER
jgi:hypothetical protein